MGDIKCKVYMCAIKLSLKSAYKKMFYLEIIHSYFKVHTLSMGQHFYFFFFFWGGGGYLLLINTVRRKY